MKKFIASLALLAGLSSAQAVVLDSYIANGNSIDNSFSTSTMFSPEIGLNNALPVIFNLTVEANDGASLSFNAVLKNFIGYGIQQLSLSLNGASFASLGSAAGSFGSTASVAGGANAATVAFVPAEYFQTTLGDWYLDGSGTDWTISLTNLRAGDQFSLAVAAAVPEPHQGALVLTGLSLMLLAARCRKH